MYLALALMVWVALYATSTLLMNHRGLFALTGGRGFEVVSDGPYRAELPADRDARAWARQILKDLDLEGRHHAEWRENGRALVIRRQIPGRERRITYRPAEGRLVVEAAPFRFRPFVNQLHTAHGYGGTSSPGIAWAVLVDLGSAAMIVWALSGLYLWWEMGRGRAWGGVALGAGVLVCAGLIVAL
jgi:hypothetical protein